MFKNISLLMLLICVSAVIIFFIRDSTYLDPDYDWHLATGNYILEHGAPTKDLFSYTMPNYPWIEHEWLSDVIYALALPIINTYGLALVQALIIVLTLYLTFKNNIYIWTPAIFLLAAGEFMYFPGIRPQIFSWFFFSILLFIVLDANRWKKYAYLIPLIIIAWVNLHGGFAIGIFLLFIKTVGESLKRKKLFIEGAVILITSAAVTLINPYGIRIWEVVFGHFTSSELKLYVSDWSPGITALHPSFIFTIAISIIIAVKYLSKFKTEEIIMFILLYIAALSSIKYIPFWFLVTIIFINKGILYFKNDLPGNIKLKNFRLLIFIFFLLSSLIFIFEAWFSLKTSYYNTEELSYPKKAIEFLRTKGLGKNIFSPMGWSGYIVWKLPNRKIYIDGRMLLWKNKVKIKNESQNIFMESIYVIEGKIGLEKIVDKYKIDTIILPEAPLDNNDLFLKIASIGHNKKLEYDFLYLTKIKQQITKTHFKKIYKDNVSVIYQRF